MKAAFYFLAMYCPLLFWGICNSQLFAQCGTAPTSGTTTISANSILNSYYPGTGSPVKNTSTLIVGALDARGSSNPIAMGDLIFIVQMQGADINSTNTLAYGAGGSAAPASGYLNNGNLVAGNYEYATVSNVVGTTITLTYNLVNSYYTSAFNSTTPQSIQSYQVVRVARYYNLTINTGISVSAPAWNGSTGGVVILEVANTFALNGSVTTAGAGFRGGGGKELTGAITGNSNGSGGLTNTDYRFNSAVTNTANLTGGAKGEGIAGTPVYYYTNGAAATATGTLEGYLNGSMGWGAPGNAGGGGTDGAPVGATSQNQYNTGGGGGGNGGAGGKGGNGWPGAGNAGTLYPTGGYGGAAFAQYSQQKLIMGGGGGAGTANNSVVGGNEVNSSGGTGGGIIIARALTFSGSGSVIADGANAPGVNGAYGSSETDAAGGGGAGGTIIIVTTQGSPSGMGSITASAVGGVGGSVLTYYNHGPGGGGGGGIIYTDITLGSTAVTGGANGVTYTDATHTATYAYYSITGSNGIVQSFTGGSSFISVGTPCGVLPIVLKSFSASLNGSSVDLNWQAEDDLNFSYFEIQYSTDGINFSTIGDVNYITGKTSYTYIHQTPQQGTNYYRLKLVDENGRYTYSNILLVNLNENTNNKLLLYPNPVTDFATLQFNADSKQQVTIDIFDNTGRKIINRNFNAEKGQNYFSLPDIQYLSRSIYMVKVTTISKIYIEKLLVKK
jgi:type IX secretion system substrate protein